MSLLQFLFHLQKQRLSVLPGKPGLEMMPGVALGDTGHATGFPLEVIKKSLSNATKSPVLWWQ